MASSKGVGKGNGSGSRATRIKPGEVRNPRGRPKGATGAKADFRREMKRMEEIRTPDGATESINAWRLMIRRAMRESPKNARLFAHIVALANRYDTEDERHAMEHRRKLQRIKMEIAGTEDLTEEDYMLLFEKHGLFKD